MLTNLFRLRSVSSVVMGLVALAAVPLAAHAQSVNAGADQKYWLQLGAFRPSLDTQFRFDDNFGGAGTTVDGENDLGLKDSKTIGNLLLGARLGERWRLEFEYFALNRSASKTVNRTIKVGDNLYPVSQVVDSRFDSKVYRLSGGYSLVKTPQAEFGVTLGLHVTDFDVGLNASQLVNGVNVASRSEQRSETLPLPTIGIYGNYALTSNWELSGRADAFSLHRGDYDGSLLNLQANLAYRFTPQVSLALGYRASDYKLTSEKRSNAGFVEYKFRGPQLTLQVGF